MNSIKFLVSVTVIGLTLTGLILMDPSFKSSIRATDYVQNQRVSTSSECSIDANSTTTSNSIALNFVH